MAPDLIQIEVANVLRSKVRLGEIVATRATAILDTFLTSAAVELRSSSGLLRDALGIAVDLDHSIYDALYIALARAEACQVVTSDRRLLLKARSTRYAAYIRALVPPA